MRKLSAVAAFVAALLAGGTGPASAADASLAMQSVSTTTTSINKDTYKIGPQDLIEVAVFQIEDLSKTVEVNMDGNVLLPLVGEIRAAGYTPSEFSDALEEHLRATYVKDPRVTVSVKESSSRRVTVDGAVVSPGIYPLTGPTTLLQAVALAKGPDPREANLRKVAIFRNEEGGRRATLHDLSAIRAGKQADPLVQPDDVIVVETSRGRSLLRDITGALPLFSILF
ncbi:MAG TPA: polysaccharide biosynthesis/export family protein [Caulobacteraceae bacterium]|nr:polysaccharide biosynthesis/export family protein [Caulobacteraceae bacterium]